MQTLQKFAEKVEKLGVLDQPATRLVEAIRPVVASEQARHVLGGGWLGHPMHPLMVTIPIGSWTSALVLDLTGGDATAARRLVGVGVVAAAPTVAAGLSDWADKELEERDPHLCEEPDIDFHLKRRPLRFVIWLFGRRLAWRVPDTQE